MNTCNTQEILDGRWITTYEFENLKPVNVFHRQLEKITIPKEPIENRHLLFRKKFELEEVEQSFIRISADDYYKLYINGRFVTQGPCPGFPFHYYFNRLDVTEYLKKGENVLAVHTYYQGLINRVWVSGDNQHGLILDLKVNGRLVVKSDESFRCAVHSGYGAMGKAGYDTQFLERYDSNAGEDGFEKPGFDDENWNKAVTRKHTDYVLYPQPTRQLAFDAVRPVSLTKTEKGYIADFGSVYVGYPVLKARGEKGSTVLLRCGQELSEDGSVRFNLRANCRYEEEWVLSGREDNLNPFDYKSFRYAELVLPPGARISEDSLMLMARHYPFSLKARCNTEDPELRKVWELCVHSLRYGVQEVIQDCMEREKGQYLGDGCYSSLSLAVLTGETAMMEKLIDDALRTAFINEGLMTCSPCSFMQEIADFPLFLPFFVLAHYHLTGNKSYMKEKFDGLSRLIRFYKTSYETETGLLANLDKWCVVDWPASARDGYDVDLTEGQICRSRHNVINALYIGAAKYLNKIAALLGEKPVVDTEPLEKAFVAAFYDEEAGLFKDSDESGHISLPSNAYALLYGLCPDSRCEENILALIEEKRLLSSMFFITFAVLAALKKYKRDDLIKELLSDERCWLRMLREGATTTWEGWGKNSKANISFFHLAFTYPVLYLADWDMEGFFSL